MVNPSEKITVWSRDVGRVCTSGGPKADYQVVKSTLLAVYQVSTETHRKKVFEQSFNSNKPDQWLRDFKQKF